MADRNTGEPVRGARVWALTREGRQGEAETDANGVAELKVGAGRPDDVRVVGRNGGDFMINTLSSWAFRPNAADFRGYVYTDRPVYRPGHTVHFRGVLRWRTASGYDVPAGKPVSVEIQDAEQKALYRKTLTTNANGTIHDDFVLGSAATLGNYFIEVKSGEDQAGGNFEVEEYKKPEYEVRVTPLKPRVLQGESVQAAIDSRYYFGEPVSGAKVQYSVYRDRYWFPLWYDPEDDMGAQPEPEPEESGDEVAQGEGQLDNDGKLTIRFETTQSENKFDYSYRVEARVTDQGKREITGKGWVVATYGSFLVNVRPERYVCAPGAPAQFLVEARDYDSKPVNARVHVELLHWNWRDTANSPVVATTDVETGPGGSATASLPIPREGGTYRVRATAVTPEGREVEGDSYAYVAGGGEFGPRGGTDVKIITDKKTYQAGDTAKLLIAAAPDTPVYVSVEGRDLRELKLIRSAGPTIEYAVPIAASDEPGLTVSAGYVRRGNFYSGMKYVRVPPVAHQLNVKLTSDKPQYQPGQTAEYRLEVSGSDGRPASRAEFSLGVVDEAIYGVRKDTTPEMIGFFFGKEWNSVYTDNSLTYYFTGEAGKRRMMLASMLEPSRLAQLKPERLVQPKVRKAFPDTAFWAADLVTDDRGRARAKVEFPDSLTAWRATARGVTPDTRVGGAVLKTIVRKNLILRLVVPRFFVQGDELVISALVHNYLADAKAARVSLDVTGLDVLEGATRDVAVPSRGEARVDWRVRAKKEVRSATVLGKALTDEESDALDLELPVNVPGVKMSQSRSGAVPAGAAAAFDLAFPDKVEPGSRRLSIRLSPSIAGSLFGALEFLTSYPYGCVEQTMSSFLPNIIVTQAARDLGLSATLDEAAVQEKIRAGLDRLYNFQHEDGGWGWWETDDTHPFMTAYVVAGLAQAKAAGVQVKDEAVRKGVEWLKSDMAKDTKLAGDLRAYMVYALAVAGQPDSAALGAIFTIRGRLSPYGLALLGLALEQAKDARAAEIAAALESAAKQDGEQAWWPATRDELLDFSEDATPEATAYAVKFLSHQRRDSALLPKAALWLMNHRNEGFWWSSTKQTAMVVYGLTDYVKATGELKANLNATVFVNGSPVVTRKLDQATGLAMPETVLEENKLQPGVNHIRVAGSGEGRLYFSVRAEYSSTDENLQQTGTMSLNMLRDYFRLAPARDGEKIVYDLAPLNGPVASGDTIAVRLTVSGSEWKYMMIEDPIPSGTEFIERDQIYQLKDRPPWWQWEFTRRELHDDRVTIFQTWFPRGQQQYFYLLKVVNPGTFQVSPSRVGPMYQSDVFATTGNRRLEVR